ncbi:MAG: hypothetical protein AB7S48_14000 [Bacteroidales bacterium]
MKLFQVILISLFALGLANKALPQSNFKIDDTLRSTNFRIIDVNTQEPIGFAHVINQTKFQGEISDLLGYVNIKIAFGDNIKITAIGYETKEILSLGQFKSDTIFYPIQLTPKVYEIKEVKISRFTTYERFLREVANLKIPKTKEEEQEERLQNYFLRIVNGADLINLPNGTSGVGFGEDWYHKQKVKLEKLIDKEHDKRIIEQKYNPGLVQKLTGLSGDELYKFLAELNLENDYLLKSSDYEIQEKILDKFERYKKQKESEKTKPEE